MDLRGFRSLLTLAVAALALGHLGFGGATRGADNPPAPGPPAGSGPDAKKCECCAVKGASRPDAKRYTRVTATYRLPEVTLLDMNGREVPLASVLDSEGPVMLQFVFTTCPTICGALSGTFSAVQEKLGDDLANGQMVSISIDPEHDRPEQLRRYAKSFGAGKHWRLFTGRREDIAAVQKAFDAYRANKMSHEPLTFLRPGRNAPWVRLTGLLSAADLAAEYRSMAKP